MNGNGVLSAPARWRTLPSMTETPPLTGTQRVALVTGAAGGLGREFAIALAARGHRVAGLDLADMSGTAERIPGDRFLPVRADVTDRVQPGVVYTTFHFPESGANVVTTDNSDWATNCPEYKVTAVQAVKVTQPSAWQLRHRELSRRQRRVQDSADATN